MALTQELYNKCCTILMKCSEFDTDNSLRAIFVIKELNPFERNLHQCNTKGERVNQLIYCLLREHLSGNRPVLPVFISQLISKREQGDQLRDELVKLHKEVSQTLKNNIIIPFVIAAMTSSEASELLNETVFDTSACTEDDLSCYRKFKNALDICNVGDLVSCYDKERDAWKPLVSSGRTIEELIYEMLDDINQNVREPDLPLLSPLLLTRQFFEQDQNIRKQLLRQLNQSGGVLIMDAISMLHPSLYRSVKDAGIGLNNNVALLILSPFDSNKLEINQLIKEVIELQMGTTFFSFEEHWNILCEIGIGGIRTLNGWLSAVLPDLARKMEKDRPSQAKLKELRERLKQEKTNINSVIS